MSEGKIKMGMAARLRLSKCCCCLSLDQGAKVVGGVLLLFTLGVYIVYLIKIEDIRDYILDDLYGIIPCTIPPIDTVIDMAFEYSIIANILLVVGCVGCTRWLLVPWLVIYTINIILLTCLAMGMLIIPVPLVQEDINHSATYQALRALGIIPLIMAAGLGYFLLVIRSLFIEMGESDKPEGDPCCPMKMKTGVQIIGGILAILSGVILVLFFAKLDELISRRYLEIYEAEISRGSLTCLAGLIVVGILLNILLILGGSGGRWRRGLLLPWLLFYGVGIVCCLVAHIYYTSLCWREEKIIGLLCLGTGFIFLVLWSLVWIVSAQITEKSKTIISTPGPLAFQRL